ncbi:MAG: DUF368 domain-containing protein [Hungatella sp.]|nr:DUF368 domain-containing protein [Hungatella sp.]
MTFILDIIKGMLIGIANIIPGVSGGTMAVSLGIYDKLISSISGLLKDWKKSARTLFPIILGCGMGIVCFTYVIEYLLSRHTFVTCMAFVGLILGGVPVLISSLKKELEKNSSKIGVSAVLAFLILFAVAILLPMMNADDEVLKTFSITPGTIASLFLVGVIASATMVVPGVSGSLVMMILGYYYGIINTIKSFLDSLKAFDIGGLIHGFALLMPFGIGVLLGIFLIAKLITFLFQKFGIQTYCAILGLIAASPFAIFYNTGALGQLSILGAGTILLSVILALVFGVVTYKLGE